MSEHRETASADIHQAISGLVGDIASGRVEELRSFSRKFGSESQIFVKKKKRTTLPQANLTSIW
jgi:hypothetical protein